MPAPYRKVTRIIRPAVNRYDRPTALLDCGHQARIPYSSTEKVRCMKCVTPQKPHHQ